MQQHAIVRLTKGTAAGVCEVRVQPERGRLDQLDALILDTPGHLDPHSTEPHRRAFRFP